MTKPECLCTAGGNIKQCTAVENSMAVSQIIKNSNTIVKVKVTQSSPALWTPYSPWNSLSQNTGEGSLSLLQGIFPTQGSNPGLPRCRQVLYHLSNHGSPSKVEWVTYPFSRGSSWTKEQTGVSCIAGRFLTSWVTR